MALPPLESGGARAAERVALRLLQLAALAVVLVAVSWREYELDRFFVPKELVLHATAAVGALLVLRRFRGVPTGAADLCLALFLVVSAAAALPATNGWLALRALAISASGAALFWVARALRAAGLARPLLGALALAVCAGAVSALAQAYGVTTDLFSLNRAPGGMLGNRNFVAHMAAFGLPVVLLVALRARSTVGYLLGAAGAPVVAATLVLTRSRAGWLAAAAGLLVLLAALLVARATRRDGRTWRRLGGVLLLTLAGVAGALLLPNALRWQSESPYLDSVRGVANYQEGSGAGRLVQYRRSFALAAARPILGVGPGNWPVIYPAHAPGGDPSLSGSAPGTTSNPWPSSDWVAFLSERGFAAAALLALAFAALAGAALRALLRTRDAAEALAAAALVATLTATVVAGLFDAVLLLALPSLLVWATLGALAPAPDAALEAGAAIDETWRAPRRRYAFVSSAVLLAAALLAGAGALRSAAQLASMGIYANARDTTWLARAARIDPGNYRLRLRLARAGSGLPRAERCGHARAAHAQFPSAREARNLARACGG